MLVSYNLGCHGYSTLRSKAHLLPSLLAVEHDLLQNEDDKEPEDDDELGHWVVDLCVVSVLDLVEDVVEGLMDVYRIMN